MHRTRLNILGGMVALALVTGTVAIGLHIRGISDPLAFSVSVPPGWTAPTGSPGWTAYPVASATNSGAVSAGALVGPNGASLSITAGTEPTGWACVTAACSTVDRINTNLDGTAVTLDVIDGWFPSQPTLSVVFMEPTPGGNGLPPSHLADGRVDYFGAMCVPGSAPYSVCVDLLSSWHWEATAGPDGIRSGRLYVPLT